MRRSKRMTFHQLARFQKAGRVKQQDAAIPADKSFAWSMIVEIPPSVNHYLRRGKNGQVYKTEHAKEYQETLGYHAKRIGAKLAEGRVAVEILLVARETDADADNVGKCVLDALQGIAYLDDSQVWKFVVIREPVPVGGRPHIHLTVERYFSQKANYPAGCPNCEVTK